MSTRVSLNPQAKNASAKIIAINSDNFNGNINCLRNYLQQGHIIAIQESLLSPNCELYDKPEIVIDSDCAPIDIFDAEKSHIRDLSHHKFKKPDLINFAKLVSRDLDEFKLLVSDMQEIERKVLAATELLTGIKLKCKSTWRYTSTSKTFYHLDDIRTCSPINIKCFWNLSDKPRRWSWGHLSNDISKLCGKTYHEWHEAKGIKNPAHNAFNRYLNSIMQGLERHEVDFGKYDLWITDAQKTAHQCIAGNKVAVFDFHPHPSQDINCLNYQKLDYRRYIHIA